MRPEGETIRPAKMPETPAARLPRVALRVLLRYAPLTAATAALAFVVVREILAQCGRPAVPLDDAYIHFQYARAIAEAHPFRYTPGAAPTPGATSILWPLLLAPFHALGLRREAIVWAAWALGFTSLALTALETSRLAAGLVSRGAALAAGAMVLSFGAFVWFAGSGMEVLPFAWLLTWTIRSSSEWLERAPGAGGPRRGTLIALAILTPLMRPEGALVSLVVFACLLLRPQGSGKRARLGAALALLGPVAPTLFGLIATGQAVQSTALAKWLPLNPYYRGAHLLSAILSNVELFFGTLLDGRLWTAVFIPSGGRLVALLALAAVPFAGVKRGHGPRAVLVLVLALGALLPTTYETFLVNRVRYIWPFFTGFIVALAALSELLGGALAWPFERLGARAAHGSLAVASGFVVLLASRLSWTIQDLAGSSRAVTTQQVSLAEWAGQNLAKDARLGVNDTGALAYFSDRATFDVVGLTTSGEARYWTAGPGSRFEHYEHLAREKLPTHFIVYPEWFAIDPLLGEELTYRTVRHTILGGTTMAVYRAHYALLRSGEAPEDPSVSLRRLLDSVDVSDVESERAHGYSLLDATREENIVASDPDRADGGRTERVRDRFSLVLAPGGLLVARWSCESPSTLVVRIDGRKTFTRDLRAGPWGDGWEDVELQVPPSLGRGTHLVEVEAHRARFGSFHYWSYE